MHDQITDLRFASKSILKSAASSSRFLVARWQIHRQRGFMAWVNVSGTRHSSKNGHSTYEGRERVTAVGTRLEEHRATLQENFVGAVQCTLATPWCFVRNTSVDFLLKQLNVKRMGKVLFSNLIPFLLLSTEGNFTASQDTKSAKLHMTPTHAQFFLNYIYRLNSLDWRQSFFAALILRFFFFLKSEWQSNKFAKILACLSFLNNSITYRFHDIHCCRQKKKNVFTHLLKSLRSYGICVGWSSGFL